MWGIGIVEGGVSHYNANTFNSIENTYKIMKNILDMRWYEN